MSIKTERIGSNLVKEISYILATEIKDFQTLINKMFRNIKNNPSDAIKLLEIQKYYEENPKKRGDLMDVAGEGKDELIRYFDTQISNATKDTNKEEQVESLNNNFSNKLNEANEELGEGNKPYSTLNFLSTF